MQKVVAGLAKFQQSSLVERQSLFDELATGQSPEVMFITCADSRIDPCLITQTDPGDLFVCRNAGNIVPRYSETVGGITASVEFAVAALGVQHIVVCGHSDCGAMKGAINPDGLDAVPQVQQWVGHSQQAVDMARAKTGEVGLEQLDTVTEQNVILQLENLRSHPAVEKALAARQIELHGWVYDIGSGDVSAYDESRQAFVSVKERYADMLTEAAA